MFGSTFFPPSLPAAIGAVAMGPPPPDPLAVLRALFSRAKGVGGNFLEFLTNNIATVACVLGLMASAVALASVIISEREMKKHQWCRVDCPTVNVHADVNSACIYLNGGERGVEINDATRVLGASCTMTDYMISGEGEGEGEVAYQIEMEPCDVGSFCEKPVVSYNEQAKAQFDKCFGP